MKIDRRIDKQEAEMEVEVELHPLMSDFQLEIVKTLYPGFYNYIWEYQDQEWEEETAGWTKEDWEDYREERHREAEIHSSWEMRLCSAINNAIENGDEKEMKRLENILSAQIEQTEKWMQVMNEVGVAVKNGLTKEVADAIMSGIENDGELMG